MTPTQTLQRLTRRRLVQRDIRIRRMGTAINRWTGTLEDRVFNVLRRGRGGPEGVHGELRYVLGEALDDLVRFFWVEFQGLADWSYRSAAENMVRAVPLAEWVKRILPAVPILGVESRGGAVGVVEDIQGEVEVQRILDGDVTDTEAREIVRKIEFPPPSQLRVNMLIRHAPWPDGLEWPSRIKTKWAVDMERMSSELSQGYAAGENLEKLGHRLRPYCAEDSGINYKCRRLARTEGSRIAEEAQRDIYEDAGDLVQGIAAHNSQDGKVRLKHWRWQRPGAPPTIFYKQPETGMYIAKTGEMKGEPLPAFPADPNCRCFSMPHLAPGLEYELPAGAVAGRERFERSPNYVLNMPAEKIARRSAPLPKPERAFRGGARFQPGKAKVPTPKPTIPRPKPTAPPQLPPKQPVPPQTAIPKYEPPAPKPRPPKPQAPAIRQPKPTAPQPRPKPPAVEQPRPTVPKPTAPKPRPTVPKQPAPKPAPKPKPSPKPKPKPTPEPKPLGPQQAAVKAEAEIAGGTNETAVVFDNQGKELFRRTGSSNAVEFSAKETERLRGATLTHNHPAVHGDVGKATIHNLPLSGADGSMLADHGLADIRAVTRDYVYSLKPKPGATLADGKKIMSNWRRRESLHYRKEAARLGKLVNEGQMTPVEARRLSFLYTEQSQHKAWLDIADKSGLDYTRILRHAK